MLNMAHRKIGTRLTAAFAVVVLTSLVVGGVGIYGILDLGDDLRFIGMDRIPDLTSLAELASEQMTIRALSLEVFQTQLSSDRRVALEKIRGQRARSWDHIDKAWETFMKIPRATERGKQILSELERSYRDWRGAHRDLDEVLSRILRTSSDYELGALYAEYRAGFQRMVPVSEAMGESLDALIRNNNTVTAAKVSADIADGNRLVWICSLVLGLCVLLCVGLGIVLTRSILGPVKASVDYMGLLAQGDFSRPVPETLMGRGDEMGDLARAYETMVKNTRALLERLAQSVQTVASSATEFSAISSQTASNVQTLSARTSTVVAAAEEASVTTASLAAAMEQASTNLTSVAGATEEMSATIGEIAANAEKARAISEDAGAQAASVSGLMQQLGEAAQEIGKVTETITDISSQTNLLALNATIEAARAGAAGKGFAVVANEIKELARQTAGATEDIKARIGGVQSSAGSAIADIQKITGIVAEVGHLVASIATAIEEQASVTRDVAGNIAQASSGVQEATENVAQTASVSRSIAGDIAAVDAAAGEIRSGGEQIRESASELSNLAEALRGLITQFKL